MRLRTKLAVAVLAVTIVLSSGVYGGLELYKDRVVGGANAEVNETAALTADQIDSSIQRRKDFVGFVASRPEASQFNRSGAFLSSFVDNSRFFAAQLVAANGTIVDFYGDVTGDVRREAIGSDVGDRRYVREALSGTVFMTDPERANATGKYVAIISAPVFEDREIVGVLAAGIYVDRQTVFTMMGPLEASEQSVVVRDGDTVLYGEPAPFGSSITDTAKVETTGWTVTVARDRAVLTNQLRDLAIAQGIGLFLVLLSAVGFGVWEYRTTLDQTEQLLEGFAALEAGSFDHRLSLSAAEEWTQISDGFNELAASLSAREAELRRREERLEVLNRVLRHNLRNSAAIIMGYGDMIENRADDPEIADAGGTIVETIAELSDLGQQARRIEELMDRTETEPRPVEVTAIVDDIVADCRQAHPEATIRVDTPEHAHALAIPSIRLALLNLCENACEHTESAAPTVDVSVAVEEGSVRISVADDGPGIPEQEIQAISERQETALEHGSGLGLWLVEWTVEHSAGSLAFTENGAGGTTVTITLERTEPSEDGSGGAIENPTPAADDD